MRLSYLFASTFILSQAALASAAASANAAAGAAAASQATLSSQTGIETSIENFLMKNPEVIEKALIKLQEKRDQEAKEKAQKVIVEHSQDLYGDKNAPIMGNPKGKKQLVLFADPNCGHCRTFHKTLEAIVQKDPEVKIIFKDIAILGPGSAMAVHLALAAHMQGKYSAFMNEMLKKTNAKSMDELLKIAEAAGVDVNRAKIDMESEAIKKMFNDNWELAAKLGIEATPSFVVGQELYTGGLAEEELMQVLNASIQVSGNNPAKDNKKY